MIVHSVLKLICIQYQKWSETSEQLTLLFSLDFVLSPKESDKIFYFIKDNYILLFKWAKLCWMPTICKKKTWFQVIWGCNEKYKLTSALKEFRLPAETNAKINQCKKRQNKINCLKEVEAKHTGNRRIMRI